MIIPHVFIGQTWLVILSCVIAYLIGSVSTGLIVSRIANGPDLRKVGSGNTGASNVQRTMGWSAGLITFAGDSLKGVAACLIAWLICGDYYACLAAGLFVIIGHNWPVYYHFQGGKGVAASCGVLLYCFPVPAVICFALTVALIAATRYISLGSMFLLTAYSILVSVWYYPSYYSLFTSEFCLFFVVCWTVLLAIICIARHHANIIRLIHGTENKLGKKKTSEDNHVDGNAEHP